MVKSTISTSEIKERYGAAAAEFWELYCAAPPEIQREVEQRLLQITAHNRRCHDLRSTDNT